MPVSTWPAALRQLPRRNSWTGGPRDFRRAFRPDQGHDIQRPGSTAEVVAYDGVVFPNLTGAQMAVFEAFQRDDLVLCTRPFVWADPVTGLNWLWRIAGDGRLSWSSVAKGADNHDLTLNLVRLPGPPWWQPYAPVGMSAAPALVMDFQRGIYGVRGDLRTGLSPLLTLTRSGTATRVNASGFVETVAADTPRIDHDPLTGAAIGLLIEPARTNLCLRSSDIADTVAWANRQNCTVTGNAALAPDNTTTADLLVATSGVALLEARALQTIGFSANAPFSHSCWLKSNGMRPAAFVRAMTSGLGFLGDASCTLTMDGSAIASQTVGPFTSAAWRIERHANSWTRLILEGVTPATTGNMRVGPANGDVGNGTSGLLFWGGQLEAAAHATSFIPTAAATVSRGADSAIASDASLAALTAAGGGTMIERLETAGETVVTPIDWVAHPGPQIRLTAGTGASRLRLARAIVFAETVPAAARLGLLA